MSVKMRAKMVVMSVTPHSQECETLTLYAVSKSDGYPEDGSDENNTFARWTPSANMSITISNPDLIGKFPVGQEIYVDFTPAAAPVVETKQYADGTEATGSAPLPDASPAVAAEDDGA